MLIQARALFSIEIIRLVLVVIFLESKGLCCHGLAFPLGFPSQLYRVTKASSSLPRNGAPIRGTSEKYQNVSRSGKVSEFF